MTEAARGEVSPGGRSWQQGGDRRRRALWRVCGCCRRIKNWNLCCDGVGVHVPS